MLLSQQESLRVLQGHGIHVPSHMWITPENPIPQLIKDLEWSGIYVIPPSGSPIPIGTSDTIEAVQSLVEQHGNVMICEPYEALASFLLKISIDQDLRVMLTASTKTSETSEIVDPSRLWPFQMRRMANTLSIPADSREAFFRILQRILAIFSHIEATSLEISPLVHTKKNLFIALRCSIEIDDHAHQSALLPAPNITDFNIVQQGPGKVIAVANGRLLALALADCLQSNGVSTSMVIDAEVQALSKIIELANEHRHKIVVYLFTGLKNAVLYARAIEVQLTKESQIGLYLEGTNVSSGKNILRNYENYCRVFATIDQAVAWAKES